MVKYQQSRLLGRIKKSTRHITPHVKNSIKSLYFTMKRKYKSHSLQKSTSTPLWFTNFNLLQQFSLFHDAQYVSFLHSLQLLISNQYINEPEALKSGLLKWPIMNKWCKALQYRNLPSVCIQMTAEEVQLLPHTLTCSHIHQKIQHDKLPCTLHTSHIFQLSLPVNNHIY
jgi:hypothetical protein